MPRIAPTAAIEVENLRKTFGEVVAVDDVSFTIKPGEIFGLLGPNGAGKTTIISMLATLLTPSAGVAKVDGHDVRTRRKAVRKKIGLIFQDPSLDSELTGRENLDFHGRLYQVAADERARRIEELSKLVELEDKLDRQVKTYSGGMKRRLEIIRGLLHHPQVLFLDEPTIGLDPQTRRALWKYIRHVNKTQKLTIILTTHYMEEADELCNRVAIIDKGKVVAMDTPQKLKQNIGGDVITVETIDGVRLQKALTDMRGVREIKILDNHVNVVVGEGKRTIPRIMEAAQKSRVTVESISLKQPSLEDVFIHFTGHGIRDQDADAAAASARAMWKVQGNGR